MKFMLTKLSFVMWTLAFSQPLAVSKPFNLTVSDTPFAAFQDGDGAWRRLKLGVNALNIQDPRARFALLIVCQETSKTDAGRSTQVRVLKLTTPEASALEWRCPKPASVTLSGNLEGVKNTCVNFHLAGRRSQWCNYDSSNRKTGRYAIGANPGRFDLFAAPLEPTEGAPMLERLAIVRDLGIRGAGQQNLNLANAIALLPKTLGVTAPDSVKRANTRADYWSRDGSLIGLGGALASDQIPRRVSYGSLPANGQLALEHYLFRAFAPVQLKDLSGTAAITVSLRHTPTADTNLFLTAAIPAPKILRLSKNVRTPELALEIAWDGIDNASAYSWRIAAEARDWTVYTTSAYLGETRNLKDNLPDLSPVPGWNPNGDWAFYSVHGAPSLPLEFHAVLERKGFSLTAASALLSQNDADLSLEKAVDGSSLVAAGAVLELKP
jgi:hypothetical protein